jgi:hypothetical protein
LTYSRAEINEKDSRCYMGKWLLLMDFENGAQNAAKAGVLAVA